MLLFGGCGSKPEKTETPIEEVNNPVEQSVSEEEAEEQETPFIFRDVFGVEYETVINPDIPAKPYSDDAFNKNGDIMSYSGGDYSLGIDVSHHQGYIDFNAVKEAGYDFVIARIGYRGYGEEGSLNADREFDNYYRDAKAAGLQVGAYFFAQAVNEEEAKEEADFVLGILNGRELDLPVVYDPESILDDVARTDNVSGEQFTANTKVFCETIAEAGYEPMIYANMLWEAFELDLSKLEGYPIWYADYEDKPQTPYDFVIWQYTNEGSVPGVEGVCDIDIMIHR
ncbi:MAG: glycoside hydrolase family 25 protein [Lachnospiraceae bacterium]|nr:glycoside hydrolase family 25 protein [Lachnospiraceae bacterium]